jgi:ribulose 1,5-bisphosphate synthetase/thiazole synthase
MEVQFERDTLPVLWNGDVIICEGSFAGIAAGLALAKAGKKVAVVEPRTYLGREATATFQLWLGQLEYEHAQSSPEPLAACLQAHPKLSSNGEISLNAETIKLVLEDLLMAAGIKLIYASRPVGLIKDSAGLQGLIIANKSGRQVLEARQVIDTSSQALVARLGGWGNFPDPTIVLCKRVLEFSGVQTDTRILPVPQSLGMRSNQVTVHAGFLYSTHKLVECEFWLSFHNQDQQGYSRLEVEARQKTFAVAEYLMNRDPGFQKAYLGGASYELSAVTINRMEGNPDEEGSLRSIALPLKHDSHPIPLSCFTGPVRGLWCLNPAADLADALRLNLDNLLTACKLGVGLGNALGKIKPTLPTSFIEIAFDQPEEIHPASSLFVRELDTPQQGRYFAKRVVGKTWIKPVSSFDVLVVGGGTAGAIAAIQAARRGVRTCLVDMNPELGGTSTIGGVHSYWFGQRKGFVSQIIAEVEETHRRIRHKFALGEVPKWNIQAKAQAIREMALKAGVEILTQTQAFAVIMQENRIKGALFSTPVGPIALLAKVVIDATGDGDLAVYAGAEFNYGAARDHVTMWYSLGQFTHPGVTRNNFTSTVDVSNVEDYTRAILAGRRRGNGTSDHSIYVAPRESRHIIGDVLLTHTDQLLRRQWRDVIGIAFSNHDIKGQTTSDWVRVGLIPPNLEIEIPYSALLPWQLENLLVVGKAISATHDALPAIRMQADVENIGGAAGCAAALAVKRHTTVRAIDIHSLQQQLAEEGALPPEIVNRIIHQRRYSEAELEALIGQLRSEKPLYSYADMEINEVFQGQIPLVEICCAGPQCIPLLEKALKKSRGKRRLLLAQALALVGNAAGAPVLIKEIQQLLQDGPLPERTAKIRHTQQPPDQGAMPDVVYLLYSLGMTKDPSAIPVFEKVIEQLLDVTETDLRTPSSGIFNFIDAVCYGIERLASPELAKQLESLSQNPIFHGNISREGFQVDYFKERIAYLELVIARTMARCGNVNGLVVLIEYLKDARALLAEHAHSELIHITGKDFGIETIHWYNWLEVEGDRLKVVPFAPPTDSQLVWQEQSHSTK